MTPLSKYDQFTILKNKTEKEPALKVGASTAAVAGILTLLVTLFPHLLTQRQLTVTSVLLAFFLPIITAIFTRNKVWSVASVVELVEEAVEDAEAVFKARNDN